MRSYQGECHREGEEVPGDDGQEDGARDGERLEEEVSHEHAAEDLQETDITVVSIRASGLECPRFNGGVLLNLVPRLFCLLHNLRVLCWPTKTNFISQSS